MPDVAVVRLLCSEVDAKLDADALVAATEDEAATCTSDDDDEDDIVFVWKVVVVW